VAEPWAVITARATARACPLADTAESDLLAGYNIRTDIRGHYRLFVKRISRERTTIARLSH
jgi:hypothetical protein